MIAAIEQAMVARIASASDAGLLGYRFRTVESYGGQFEEADDLRRAMNALPGAFAVFLDEAQDHAIHQLGWHMRARFAVLVANQNKRNDAARRLGAAGHEVGTYQMVMDIRALLAGQSLGLDIDPLKPRAIKPLPIGRAAGAALSLITVEFDTGYDVEALADAGAARLPITVPRGELQGVFAAGIGAFDLAHVDWDVPAHHPAPTAPLPEGEADATDHIDLEEP